MARRAFLTRLAQLAALPFFAATGSLQGQTSRKLKILMKSAWGSDDPTKAAFPFSHALALAEAGHEVQIYLLGAAVVLMRKVVADAVTPVGWPTVGEFLNKLSAKHVQIYAAAPALAREPSPNPTWPTTERSSAARLSSCHWWNGPIT